MKDYKAIVSKLTLDEKIMLLNGVKMNTVPLPEYGIGTVQMSDATSGVRCPWKERIGGGGDVAFPSETGMAATFNRDMVRKIGAAIARNCIAHEVDILLAPATNIHRNPLCGRNFEYFSEDPYLSGVMSTEYIKGVQGEGVGTSLKHFAMNNQENLRNIINSECNDERAMREIYFTPFEMAVKDANPTTVMCSYNKINGVYASENHWLLTEVLRDEWGYDGLVVSDWGADHNYAKAVHAGLDLCMPNQKDFAEELKKGLERGWCTEEDIDKCAERVLRLADGVLNMPRSSEPYVREDLHKLAQEASADGIVLLENKDNILPINPKKVKKMTILGKYAEEPLAVSGYYEMRGNLCGGVTVDPASLDSPLEYLKQYAKENDIEITYEPLYDMFSGSIDMALRDVMINSIKEADLVLFFIGMPPYYEMEGDDRIELSFPFYMSRLATDVCRFNRNTVVIQQAGCAVSNYFFMKPPKAIVHMWLCGEGGGKAIADVLFGKSNPCGKLPMTFMNKLDPRLDRRGDGRKVVYREGMEVGYRYYDKHPEDVWFPFGHGLSYTTFEYSNIKVTPDKVTDPDETVTVTFDIKNTGDVAGKEIAQIYVEQHDPSVVRPIKELKEFAKVELEPGETKTVSVTLNKRSFAYYNTCLHDWYAEPDTYHILVGASSTDIRLTADYVLEWDDGYTMLREKWDNDTQFIMA